MCFPETQCSCFGSGNYLCLLFSRANCCLWHGCRGEAEVWQTLLLWICDLAGEVTETAKGNSPTAVRAFSVRAQVHSKGLSWNCSLQMFVFSQGFFSHVFKSNKQTLKPLFLVLQRKHILPRDHIATLQSPAPLMEGKESPCSFCPVISWCSWQHLPISLCRSPCAAGPGTAAPCRLQGGLYWECSGLALAVKWHWHT